MIEICFKVKKDNQRKFPLEEDFLKDAVIDDIKNGILEINGVQQLYFYDYDYSLENNTLIWKNKYELKKGYLINWMIFINQHMLGER
jgi:hypothetical protein